MSDHLFGTITLPPELSELAAIHRLSLDSGSATLLDGWRSFLREQRTTGPMAMLSTACDHLEHFAGQSAAAAEELVQAPWTEVVSLGIAIQAILGQHVGVGTREFSGQPHWLTNIGDRTAVQASVRNDSPSSGATPWVIEFDFGRAQNSCANVWVNTDSSLSQIYLSDESIEEVEAFLGGINHLIPNRSFERVPPGVALAAFGAPAQHVDTTSAEQAFLHWLQRTALAGPAA